MASKRCRCCGFPDLAKNQGHFKEKMDESDQISEDWLMVPKPLNLIEQTDSPDPYEEYSDEVYDIVGRIDYPDVVIQNSDQDVVIQNSDQDVVIQNSDQDVVSQNSDQDVVSQKSDQDVNTPLKDAPDFIESNCLWIDCDSKFNSHDLLIEHINRNHIQKDENSLVCQWKDCSGEKEPYNILEHMRKHTGEKPHKCSTSNRILIKSDEDENNIYENYSDRSQGKHSFNTVEMLKKSETEIQVLSEYSSEETRSVVESLAEFMSETFAFYVTNEISQSTCSTKKELSKKRNSKKVIKRKITDLRNEAVIRAKVLKELFTKFYHEIFFALLSIMMLITIVYIICSCRRISNDLNIFFELSHENVQLKDRMINQMQKDNSKLKFRLHQLSKKLERQEYMSERKILTILKYNTILENHLKNKKTDAIEIQQDLPAEKFRAHQVEEKISTEQGLPAKKVSGHQVEGKIANRTNKQEITVNHENLTSVLDHVKQFNELLTLFRDKLSSKRTKLPEKVNKPNPCLYFKSEKPLPSLGKKPKRQITDFLDDLKEGFQFVGNEFRTKSMSAIITEQIGIYKEAGYRSYKFVKTALECWAYKVDKNQPRTAASEEIMGLLKEFRKELEKIKLIVV